MKTHAFLGSPPPLNFDLATISGSEVSEDLGELYNVLGCPSCEDECISYEDRWECPSCGWMNLKNGI